MQKFLFFAVLASMAALAAPSAFEKYRAQMLAGEDETLEPPPRIAEAAAKAVPPVSAPAPAAHALGRTAQIAADESGHFRAEARINGRSVPVLIDTGATLVAFDETTARRLGVAVQPSAFTARVQTANGEAPAARATISRLKLGAIDLTEVDAIVTRDGTLPVTLLGMSFLKRLDRFEIADGRLLLKQ